MKHKILSFISIILLISSVILITYLFYKFQLNFTKNFNTYLVYFIISIFYLSFSIYFYFQNEEFKIISSIIFFSILVAFYSFEIFLTSKEFNMSKTFKYYENKTGKKYDKRSKFQIYNDLKSDKNIRPGTYPYQFFDQNSGIFPLSSFADKKIIYCNENGYWAIYNSDRYGFNNSDKVWNFDSYEYLLIGDSFTNGACVQPTNNIAGNLKKITNSKNILNLGMGAAGPIIEYAILREYAPFEKNIKRLIWIYYEGNDLHNIYYEKQNSILKKYLVDKNFTQNLKFKKNDINNKLEKTIKFEEKKAIKEIKTRKKKKIFNILKLSKTKKLILSRINKKIIVKDAKVVDEKILLLNFKKILKEVKSLSNKNDLKLYFVYLPTGERYINLNNNHQFKNYLEVTNMVQDLDITLIDINKNFMNITDNPLKFYALEHPGNHFSENGYKKVSEVIFNKINILEKK